MSRLILVLVTLLFAMPAWPALAQSDNDNLTVGDLLGGTLTPDSPALAALGITGQEITHPESPSAIATSLLSGLDAEGNFQTGLAFDFAPYLLFKGAELTLQDYRQNTLKRKLSRLQLSTALSKGVTDDDKSARAALALRWTVFDTGDPFLADKLIDCIRKLRPAIFDALGDEVDPDKRQRRLQQRITELQPQFNACRQENTPRLTQGTSLQVSFAPTFTSDTGKTSDFEGQGFAASATWALGFQRLSPQAPPGQFLLGITYREDELIADPSNKGKFFEQDHLSVGGRIVFGNVTRYLIGVEANFEMANRSERKDEKYIRYAGSLDLRLTESLWVTLSLGASSGRDDDNNEVFTLSRLRWNFSEQPKLQKFFGSSNP